MERNYKGYGQFEDTKDIIRSGRDTDRQYNDLRQKREKKNTMVHRTLHRKVMIEQREHEKCGGELKCSWAGPTPVVTLVFQERKVVHW